MLRWDFGQLVKTCAPLLLLPLRISSLIIFATNHSKVVHNSLLSSASCNSLDRSLCDRVDLKTHRDWVNEGRGKPIATVRLDVPYLLYNTNEQGLDILLHFKMRELYTSADLCSADFVYAPFFKFALEKRIQYCLKLCKVKPSSASVHNIMRKLFHQYVESMGILIESSACSPTVLTILGMTSLHYHDTWFQSAVMSKLGKLVIFGKEQSRKGLPPAISYKLEKVCLLPYPSIFHLPGDGKNAFVEIDSRRQVLVSLIAKRTKLSSNSKLGKYFGGQGAALRPVLRSQLEDAIDAGVPASLETKVDVQSRTSTMMSSIFCLQPPGDSPARRGFYEAVLLGCIPVVFRNDTYNLFPSTWQVTMMTVFIAEESVTTGSTNVVSHLSDISDATIAALQLQMSRARRAFQYSLRRDTYDGFGHMLMELRSMGIPA